ncbi:release factor [Metschnikowia bicuspidata var. bicuspidata NRRL YB-4993]|uniref:Peptide chain release factor 1, mitochondrial n=1 Tax=Metschnikowia bicuspidata var. bicuspidata NRRL YB-4993 TaxID=869754 RepID=A0A1A0HH74_9ASCO|nr:release factor [Metschnikowia bicuspidata var. bicuspidata NRRL YB-4993]OBA23351.1 release factor [Metschnikowia bicuspidata var. bicuspidata NRRL YB-4993]
MIGRHINKAVSRIRVWPVIGLTYRSNSTMALEPFKPIHPLLLQRAETLTKEFDAVEKAMAMGTFDHETSVKFSRLSVIMENLGRYKEITLDYALLREMIDEASDEELIKEAVAEILGLLSQISKTTQALEKQLLPPIIHNDKPAIMELRPGVGGSEAALFTEDLLNMYTNVASHKRWRTSVISEARGTSGMLNEAIISFDSPEAYDFLRHESGIHRVQRIPATETKGRIHTSTAAVVVLPKISDGTEQSLKEDERQFAPGEVRIDTMRAGGKGGQHVNTTDSAVRLVHIPTGIIVSQQDERSQPRNKAKAFSILRARLAQLDREREIAEQKKLRTDQVSTTDRSDKIRTYNYPQNRVTDHRCGHSVHDLPGFMEGYKMDEMVSKLDSTEFEERLQALIAQKS